MDTLAIQRALTAAGFNPGPIDGKPGKTTTAAIRAFQKARGLAVDSIVGAATAAALKAVVTANDNAPSVGQIIVPGLTIADVKRLCPKANALWATGLLAGWADIVRIGQLTTATRARHFLAQTAEESGGFERFQEDLQNYTAARLMEVWPSRFPTLASARPYAHNASALAEKVYGGRRDLGNVQPGDGWKYHGRGPIQLTGRALFDKIGRAIGLDLIGDPNQALDPVIGWETAAAYWVQSGANSFADRNDLEGETKRINGGLTNLAERKRYLSLAQGIPLLPIALAA